MWKLTCRVNNLRAVKCARLACLPIQWQEQQVLVDLERGQRGELAEAVLHQSLPILLAWRYTSLMGKRNTWNIGA